MPYVALAHYQRVAKHLRGTKERSHAKRRTIGRFGANKVRMRLQRNGDHIVDQINATLDSFVEYSGGATVPIVRSDDQKRFHFWFMQSILPQIYGATWDANARRTLQKWNITRVRHEVTVITPRRFGKTWSVAMFVASVLVHVPGIQVAIFSTGKRASSSLMRLVLGFLGQVPGASRRVCKRTAEELNIALEPLSVGKGAGSSEAQEAQTRSSTSRLYSYPGSTRGMHHSVCPSFPRYAPPVYRSSRCDSGPAHHRGGQFHRRRAVFHSNRSTPGSRQNVHVGHLHTCGL